MREGVGEKVVPDRATIIFFSGDLDKALVGFNLATTAAAMGWETTLFFTFWGLNIIKKKRQVSKALGIKRKLFKLLNRGGAERLALSKFHLLGLGTGMIKKLMKETRMPSVEELLSICKGMGVKIIACTTTMALEGLTRDNLIEEVDEFAGAATYLSYAKDSKVNLFI